MNVSLNSKRLLVRASIGTLAVLGLVDIKMNALPTTAYILEYSEQGCMANCMFCPQSSLSRAKDKVSRITWPITDFNQITYRLRHNNIMKRIQYLFISVIAMSFLTSCASPAGARMSVEENLLQQGTYIVASADATASRPIDVKPTPIPLAFSLTNG